VTFREFAPNLTRALVTLDYHPQGFSEHTGKRENSLEVFPLRAMPWPAIAAKPLR
jgi:hypothetical protein